jgi:hypothetical protein
MRAPSAPPTVSSVSLPPPRRPAWWLAISLAALLGLGLIFVQARPMPADPVLEFASIVVPGGQVAISGAGFMASAQIELQWKGIAAEIAGVQADAAGRFEAVVAVPGDIAPGVYTIIATEYARAAGAAREVTVAIRVVAQSESPGPDVVREETRPVASSPEPLAEAVPPTADAQPRSSEDPPDHDEQHAAAADAMTPSPAATHAPASATPEPSTAHSTHSPSPSPDHGGGGGGSMSCAGYPEPRTFLEVHSWWEGAPLQEGQIAHLHAGTCFPLGQTVSGPVTFDVRIVMHDNPGHLYRYETGLHTDGHGESDLPVVALDQRCAATCEFWVRTVVDTSGANDGWHELRFKPRVRFSDGSVQFTSSGWPLRTANGNAAGGSLDGSDATPDVVGRGWFEDHGYQNPTLRSVDAVLPGRTLSGEWRPTLRLDAGAGGSTPTFTAAYLNPDFHHHDEDSDGGGILLGKWNGPFRGELGIDTRTLPNGEYTLVLRVEHKSGGSRVTGLQYIPILVRN